MYEVGVVRVNGEYGGEDPVYVQKDEDVDISVDTAGGCDPSFHYYIYVDVAGSGWVRLAREQIAVVDRESLSCLAHNAKPPASGNKA